MDDKKKWIHAVELGPNEEPTEEEALNDALVELLMSLEKDEVDSPPQTVLPESVHALLVNLNEYLSRRIAEARART